MSFQKFGILAKKENNFSEWFTQIIIHAELLDYYDIKGCFIMRPGSMFIWGQIRKFFDSEIQKLDVQECYFPMLVSKKNLEMEKDHLENFNPELAWITKCGDKDLVEPVAIRPTSETIMYPAFANWLTSYRDLPLKLNQWCSVLRWEVKSTLPFIRGREFLWQEGHTCHYLKEDAEKETMTILELYAKIYEDLLAVPVFKGKKSKKETFGGAEYTLSIEAFVPGSGKGVQAATSHHLGQNFAKMFNISVDQGEEIKKYVYQNCWGFTTRSLGICAMIHSDNIGFVCPPKVAQIQAVIIMCGVKASTPDNEKNTLKTYVEGLYSRMKDTIRVHFDERENISPGFKFNHWEIRGVPIRIEIGFKDMAKEEVCLVFRHNGYKKQVSANSIVSEVDMAINTMHNELYNAALKERDEKTKICLDFKEMLLNLNEKNLVYAPWCSSTACEDEIGEKTTVRENEDIILMGAKSLCVPFDGPKGLLLEGVKCISCKNNANCYGLFGRSY